MTRRENTRGMFERFLTARMAPKRIWQAVLGLIALGVMQLLLPAPEAATARAWLETFLSRLR